MDVLIDKPLSQTDIVHRLAVPMASYRAFTFPEGENAVYFEATDANQDPWNFRLSIRRNDPNPRPELTGDWLPFVSAKGLRVGDKIILTREVDEVNGVSYTIRAQRKIFNIWVNIN